MGTFKETVFNIFNKYAPIKKKFVRANEAPFMNKELHEAIMKRFRLKNRFLKDRTENNQKNFKLQRNFCKKLLRTTKKLYYSVSSSALNIISSYLKHRSQRTKINDCFSARSNIEYGALQGSILGPLLFNINVIDLFYECEENVIANYADDTTPYSCGTNIPTVISELRAQQKFLIGLVVII